MGWWNAINDPDMAVVWLAVLVAIIAVAALGKASDK